MTHRDLVNDPIARILHIVYIRLEVGYTEQPCVVARVNALRRPNPYPDGTHKVAATIPIKAAPNVLLRSMSIAIVGREEGRGRREEAIARRSV